MNSLGSVLLIQLIISQIFSLIWHKTPGLLYLVLRIGVITLTAAVLSLFYSFYTNHFDIIYVSQHSHSDLSWYYRLSALWGGHEGSYLLWLWILNVWGIIYLRPLNSKLESALWYMMFISAMMGTYLFFFSNPFTEYIPAGPPNGADLNPLLQDPGMLIHPPILYIGYVGFVIPMVYVLGSFSSPSVKEDSELLRRVSSQIVMWLTLGIALGSWWAYRELGWGGFWFWDPVENASLMPWLAGVAMIHMARVSSVNPAYLYWLQCLALLAFTLSVLGSFLVRSGVLISVHTFASDPSRGVVLLLMLSVISLISVISLWRYGYKDDANSPIKAKNTMLAFTSSLIFMSVLAIVLLGTIYPLVSEAAGLGTVSVGAEYFNQMMTPLMIGSLALMCFVMPISRLQSISFWLMCFALFGVLMYFYPLNYFPAAMLLVTIMALVSQFFSHLKRSTMITHIGFCVLLIGLILHGDRASFNELGIKLNEQRELSYPKVTVALDNVSESQGDNYVEQEFLLKIVGKETGSQVLQPKRRYYPVSNQVMNKTALAQLGLTDIYVNMGDQIDKDMWALRVYIKPGVVLLWLGAAIMFAGFLLASRRGKNSVSISTK